MLVFSDILPYLLLGCIAFFVGAFIYHARRRRKKPPGRDNGP